MLSVMNDLKPITLFAKLDVAYSAPEVTFDSRGPGYDIVPAMAIPQSAIGQFEDEWLGVGGSLDEENYSRCKGFKAFDDGRRERFERARAVCLELHVKLCPRYIQVVAAGGIVTICPQIV